MHATTIHCQGWAQWVEMIIKIGFVGIRVCACSFFERWRWMGLTWQGKSDQEGDKMTRQADFFRTVRCIIYLLIFLLYFTQERNNISQVEAAACICIHCVFMTQRATTLIWYNEQASKKPTPATTPHWPQLLSRQEIKQVRREYNKRLFPDWFNLFRLLERKRSCCKWMMIFD